MKKRYLFIPILLLTFAAVGAGVFFHVRRQYIHTGLARFDVREEAYRWNGKILISTDGERALQYHAQERVKFEELTRVDVDLTPYGFEGETFSYFNYNGYALCPEDGYEGLWPVSTPTRFLYRAEDGLYQIHTGQEKMWPVFADSIEGVPEKGDGVLAFSSNGSYALSLADGIVTVYHTDPYNDSLRVVDVKEVNLSPWGTNFRFEAFTSEKYAVFSLEGKSDFIAVDCESGVAALSAAADQAYGERLARFFAQRPLTEEEKERYCAVWTNLLLGTETFCPGKGEEMTLFSLSPGGNYAAAKRGNEIWILSAGRAFCLTEILGGERILSVDFIYENVIAVSLLRDDQPVTYSYTILY